MNKQDYELIAQVLRESRPPASYTGSEAIVQANQTVYAMAVALSDHDPRFDRERFLSACIGHPTPIGQVWASEKCHEDSGVGNISRQRRKLSDLPEPPLTGPKRRPGS